MGLARAPGQFIETERDFITGWRERVGEEPERRIAEEFGMVPKLMLGDLHQPPLESVKVCPGRLVPDSELVAHLIVKVFKQLAPRGGHGLVDFKAEFQLKLVKRRLDLFGLAATLVDVGDTLFKVNTRLDCAQNLVTGSEDAFKELEFL